MLSINGKKEAGFSYREEAALSHLHKQYKIRYDEPFYDHGYKVETHYYYDWENGFELRE